MAIQNSGMSPESILSGCHEEQNADELMTKASESPKDSICAGRTKTAPESKSLTQPSATSQYENNEKTASGPFTEDQGADLPIVHDDDLVSNKRQRVNEPVEGISTALKATESSVLDWLKNFNEGVS